DAETGGKNVLEFSVILLLMLLFSPMSSKAHFGTLIVPGFCLARAACVGKRLWVVPLLGTAVGLAIVQNKDLVGERFYTLTLWLGCVTWESLLLLGGCLGLLVSGDNAVSSQTGSIPIDKSQARRAA